MNLLYLLHLDLRLTRETQFHFFHHAAFHAALRDRLGNPDDLPFGIAFYTPERGRVRYRQDEPYRLGVALHVEGEVSPQRFARLVDAPPQTPFGKTRGAPFGDNYRLEGVRCAVSDRSIFDAFPEPLSMTHLSTSAEKLAQVYEITIRFLSPMYIRRMGEHHRTLMDGQAFYPDKFLATLQKALKTWWPNAPFVEADPKVPVEVTDNRLMRTDVAYAKKVTSGNPKVLKGVSGSITLRFAEGVGPWALPLLLGGILGASRPTNRRQGQGRYEIVDHPLPVDWPPRPARSLLQRAAEARNLADAREALVHAGPSPGVDGEGKDEFLDNLTIQTPCLASALKEGDIHPEPLRGLLIRERKEGNGEKLRPLAIPTMKDRFLQRAVLQELEPAVEQLWEDASFAYRKGLSHRRAQKAVDNARKEGYIHVLDADIHSFFDEVDWDKLRLRLEAYFGDDPLVEALMAWSTAPIEFAGTRFRRTKGLPQGSVISPMLANLYLDALDEAIEAKGFRLVRYADEFVILCKKPEQVRQAVELVKEELARLNLVLNDEKTRETTFDSGFTFLEGLFCRSVLLEIDRKKGRVIGVLDKLPDLDGSTFETVEPRGWLGDVLAAASAKDETEATVQEIRRRPAVFPPHPKRRPVYVITGQAKLIARKQGLRIEKEGETPRMVPCNELSEIVVLGGRWVGGSVVHRAMRHRIPIAFHKWDGTPLGLVLPDRVRSPSELTIRQWEWMRETENTLDPARKLVAAKIRNIRLFVRRRKEDVSRLLADLKRAMHDAGRAESPERLRGIEGSAAHAYFAHWKTWTGGDLGEYPGRVTRGAEDPVNVMLNLLYTQLFRLTHTTILSTGLDPYLGVMHDGKGRYAALAADLMEPFRFLVDRIVLNAVNRRYVHQVDFLRSEKGPYRLRLGQNVMRRLIGDFETLLSSDIVDRRERKDTFRGHLYRQALSLARVIDGHEPSFEAFEMKW